MPPKSAPPAAPAVAAPVSEPAPVDSGDVVVAQVLDIVSAETGYPPDMLDPDLDMEAALGIDTVKQAETFAAIRESFDIERDPDLKLRDFPTLGHVVQFVRDRAVAFIEVPFRHEAGPGGWPLGRLRAPSRAADKADT